MDAGSPIRKYRRKVHLENLTFSLSIQGDYIQLASHFLDYPVLPSAKRGAIRGFSRASRLRMLSMVAQMDWKGITKGLFVTLTFPDEKWPNGVDQRNKYRYLFLRHMENYLGKQIGALWRIEWVARKSGRYRGKLLPHFHLVIPGIRYIPHRLVRMWWRQVLNHRGPLATDVRRLSSRKMHQVYIAKYCAKVDPSSSLDYAAYLNTPGRQWGVHRRQLLPFHQRVTFHDLPADAVDVLRSTARVLLGEES